MEAIVINVAEYYATDKYYGVMPKEVFNALESAFLAGQTTAKVPKSAFEAMLKQYSNEQAG